MNKTNKLLSLFLLTLVMTLPVYSEPYESHIATEKVIFDPSVANKQLDNLNLLLKKQNLSIKKLNWAINQLTALSDQAQDCVDDMSSKIKEIDKQINAILGKEGARKSKESSTKIEQTEKQSRVDSQYLNKQKKKLIDKEAKCRLFIIRANESITAYRNRLLSLQQQITFTRGYPIFERVELVHKDIQNLSIPIFNAPGMSWSWLGISLFVVMSVIISITFVYSFRATFKNYVKRRAFGLSQALQTFIVLSLFSLWVAGYQPFIDETDNVSFQKTLIELICIILALQLTQVILAIRRIDIGLKWYGFHTDFLLRLIQVIIIISGIKVIGISVLTMFESGQYLKQFYNSIIMMISLLATTYFSYQFYIKHQRFFGSGNQFSYIYRSIWLMVFTLIILDMTGFYILAVNVAEIFFALLLFSALSLVLLKGFGQAYHFLNYAPKSQAYLKRYFGYPLSPPHFELALLKVIIQIIIVLALVYLFAYLIGEASYFIDHVLDYILKGFYFAGYSFKPMHWLSGMLVFCIIVILARYISRRYSLQTLKDQEEDTQVALASILLYLGFLIAVIMGLIVAGFNFTSLAIIAGALSVGIGLGLQSIVNNFFSGLILLIEKPIKVGDRIAIGQVEGFVKKIRVRSTQVETPSKEDIIIPNSDLITEQVTNFMFANRTWRVKCAVGVAYGSDIELVRQVLLDVAKNHNDVLDTRGNKPLVLFQGFGDSTLEFELWCMINNVNKKYTVISDLNFAIDKAFRAHNIVIAFPQRDVHIKYDPPDQPPSNEA